MHTNIHKAPKKKNVLHEFYDTATGDDINTVSNVMVCSSQSFGLVDKGVFLMGESKSESV